MIRKSVSLLTRVSLALAAMAIVVIATVLVAVALTQRSGPELQNWHRLVLESEFHAGSAAHDQSLADYLDRESRLFDELQQKLTKGMQRRSAQELNRFLPGSPSFPLRGETNFNRTMIHGSSQTRGAVLMLHGMTDGPYSMRALAELFSMSDYYVLNLRMPAHGTVPSELARVQWQDWMAAVRLGAKHVRSQAGPGQPVWILGYSNGAALALKYTLDQLEQESQTPDRLVLVSPMIGVNPLAGVTRLFAWLGKIPYFEKSVWIDVYPEYDPHKYNSFPANAALQSRRLTLEINTQLERLDSNGKLAGMPPVLSFQSLVDSTVDTRAVGVELYARLPDNGSELVLFDINRVAAIESLVRPETNQLLEEMLQADRDDYAITVISNHELQTAAVRAYRKPAGSLWIEETDLGLDWPYNVFSLSHVALPFKPDDAIYGYLEPPAASGFPPIGRTQGIGEQGALAVPSSLFTRLRSNPFYDYMEKRLVETINND